MLTTRATHKKIVWHTGSCPFSGSPLFTTSLVSKEKKKVLYNLVPVLPQKLSIRSGRCPVPIFQIFLLLDRLPYQGQRAQSCPSILLLIDVGGRRNEYMTFSRVLARNENSSTRNSNSVSPFFILFYDDYYTTEVLHIFYFVIDNKFILTELKLVRHHAKWAKMYL